MKSFAADASVIYTDENGKRIDTFVVFQTDPATLLTAIDYQCLQVPPESLELHPKTISQWHLPMNDAFSFELFRKLRDKHGQLETSGRRIQEPAKANTSKTIDTKGAKIIDRRVYLPKTA